MNKISTFDLIQYAYNETRLLQTVNTRNGIDGDPVLQAEYSELLESLMELDQVQLNPSNKTIKAILRKAKTYE